MSDHQETLAQVVTRIDVSFAKELGTYYDDDLSNPNHPLHRSVPDQAVQP
jgi:hypothetical protein